MNVEEERFRTFASWPVDPVVEPSQLAAAGFYCIGPDLRVKCFSCNLEISDWENGDRAMAKHNELNPYCLFVVDPERAGNVALVPSSQQNGRENAQQPVIGRWETVPSVYRSEQARLDSFSDWPISFIVRPEALAAAGFYFLRHGDKVACAFCTGMVERWERGDIPKDEHRRHFPNCPFLMGLPVGNIPRVVNASGLAELGIQPHRGPRYPKFSTVESRLRTFDTWSPLLMQKPSDLAQAGFFMEKTNSSAQDQVRCFHCDGGLRNWVPTDTPWTEHARWFPTCPFLLLVKGQHFVETIQAQSRQGDVAAAAADDAPPPPTVEPETDKQPSRSLPSGLSSSMPSLVETASGSTCAESLEEENRRLKDARVCKICMDAEIGTVLLPCGHFVACVECAPSLMDCPVCRVTIKATVRTYLP